MHSKALIQLSILLATMSCGTVEVIDDGNADGDAGGGNPAVSPTVASVTPENGPLAGGNEVTLTGENFSESLIVIMDGKEVADVASPDATTLTFTAPAGTSVGELTDIYVYGDDGFGILNAAYVYNPVPTVASFAPTFGPLSGGQEIELRGSGFLTNNPGTPTVTISGVAATNVDVVDDTTIRVQAPSGTPALVATASDVIIETTNGTATADAPYIYVRPGLLLGTRFASPDAELGVSFFDIPTGKIASLIRTDFGIARMDLVPGDGLVVRGNRAGFGSSGRSLFAKIDLFDGVVDVVGTITLANFGSVQVRPVATIGGQLRGLSTNRQIGNINLDDRTFAAIGIPVNGTPTQGCLAPNGTNAAFHMDQGTGSLSTFNLTTGAFTAGPALSGLPPGAWRCHGATQAAGELFAIFMERTPSSAAPSILVRIAPNGVANVIADLPGGFAGGLAATPQAGF